MTKEETSAIFLIRCADRKGIVARVAGFIHDLGGNILDSDQHTDRLSGTFLMRVEFALDGVGVSRREIAAAFTPVVKTFAMWHEVHFSDERPRVGLLVSKQDHCLVDLLQRQRRGEMKIEIPVIISNHDACAMWADLFKIPFRVLPVTKETKREQERQVLAVLQQQRVELVVMARYMQVLSAEFLAEVGCPVINIHHSFLPAFIGAHPYRQAYERGVKIIGATAHYATEELDEGPIIEQDVIRVSHRYSVADLRRLGADIERQVLARAVRWHLEDRVLVDGNKTIVFD